VADEGRGSAGLGISRLVLQVRVQEDSSRALVRSTGGAAGFGFFLGDVAQEDVAQGDQAF
jgi:hypothetical protein